MYNVQLKYNAANTIKSNRQVVLVMHLLMAVLVTYIVFFNNTMVCACKH